MKKTLYIFAVLLLAALIQVGCQSTAPESPPEKAKEDRPEARSDEETKSWAPPMTVFEEWKKKLNTPTGLTLTISVPKKSFYMGEPVFVTFTYEMTDEGSVEMWGGSYDRSGRIDDIYWFASDEEGNMVVNPLGGWWGRLRFGGGLGNYVEVKQDKPFGQTFCANEWLRFDRPGKYTVAAVSRRTADRSGDYGVASNPIEITITGIGDNELNNLISRYGEILFGNKVKHTREEEEERRKALFSARFLHHRKCFPLYFKCLTKLEYAFQAALGIFGTPDRARTLQLVEKQFAQKDCPISQTARDMRERLYRVTHPSATGEYFGVLRPEVCETLWSKLWEMAKKKTPTAKAESVYVLTPASKDKPEFAIELAKCLKDMPEEYLSGAVFRVGLKEAPEICPYVIPYLKHEDIRVRSNAIGTLIKQGKEKYRQVLLEDMVSEKPQYEGSSEHIKKLPPEYQKRLVKLLEHSDYEVQERAARLLRRYANLPELKEPILIIVDMPKDLPYVRSDLLRALANIDFDAAKSRIADYIKRDKRAHDLIDCLEPLIDEPEIEKLFLKVAAGRRSDYEAKRILAAHKKLSFVPLLLDSLAKRSPWQSAYSSEIGWLEETTGHLVVITRKMGARERVKALEDWKKWWNKYKDKPEEERIKSNIEQYISLLDIEDALWGTAHRQLQKVTGVKFDESEYIDVTPEEKPGQYPRSCMDSKKLKALWSKWWKENKDSFKPRVDKASR